MASTELLVLSPASPAGFAAATPPPAPSPLNGARDDDTAALPSSPLSLPPPSAKPSFDALSARPGSGSAPPAGMSGVLHVLRDLHRGKTAIDPSCLEDIERIGEGGYAVVGKAWYTPTPGSQRKLVAVKRPKPALFADEAQHEMWTNEIELMRKLRHRSIVRFIGEGVGLEYNDPERSYIVQEYMAGGSLKSLVQRQMLRNPTPLYSDAAALDMCLQIARGLRYLHLAQPMVIHRDLKLENLLLADARANEQGLYTVKIADYGLSTTVAARRARALTMKLARAGGSTVAGSDISATAAAAVAAADAAPNGAGVPSPPASRNASATSGAEGGPGHTTPANWEVRIRALGIAATIDANLLEETGERWDLTRETGSLMYMSPEVFKGESYNEKADVFSFGVIMYEVMHRYMTLSAICIKGTPEELEAYASSVSRGYRPPIDPKWPEDLRKLIAACWSQEPADRPSMHDVVKRLTAIQERNSLSTYSYAPAHDMMPTCCVIS